MKIYQALARAVGAYHRCVKSGNAEWEAKWQEQIKEFVEQLPHGSGFDSGTELDIDASDDDKLVFTTSFHHMNEGMYDGWTEHTVTVTPSLSLGYRVKVSGRDRNQIKEYISEQFSYALDQDMAEQTDDRSARQVWRYLGLIRYAPREDERHPKPNRNPFPRLPREHGPQLANAIFTPGVGGGFSESEAL